MKSSHFAVFAHTEPPYRVLLHTTLLLSVKHEQRLNAFYANLCWYRVTFRTNARAKRGSFFIQILRSNTETGETEAREVEGFLLLLAYFVR